MSASPKHVLVVDDEADIRELLVLTLMRMGIEADTAPTCADAFARLGERAYDLCITDMRLPDGEGLDVLRLIAEKHGNTPVAVITAFGSTDNAVAALKAGAFDYLSKPIQLKQLRDVITSALKLPGALPSQRRSAAGERAAPTTEGLPRPSSAPVT
jgi:two-component system, NtrC family, response regulator PilR